MNMTASETPVGASLDSRLAGLMQTWPLTADRIIDHAVKWHGSREVVTRSVEGPVVRSTYAGIGDRARRMSAALLSLGIRPGDRVATMAWNTARHLELWYATMGIGAVCHTLNPRLFAEQLIYIVNHAEDRVLFADVSFVPFLIEHRYALPTLEHIVLLTDRAGMAKVDLAGALCFEDLIEVADGDAIWGGFDENSAAGLCYTSGTTGNPKGVLYSHRSNFLHTLVTLGSDVIGIRASDVVMPIVPMFHANCWGFPFSAPLVGAKLVMPGPKLDGASLYELLESERVTLSGAVPAVWQGLLAYLRDTGQQLTTLQRVMIGGSAVPPAIVRTFRDDHGVEVIHAWGMTETSPAGTVSRPTGLDDRLSDDDRFAQALTQGRPVPLIDLRLTGPSGDSVPHDGITPGGLAVRGPFVVSHYFRAAESAIDDDDFFDTGDVATIDAGGFMKIVDRAKDVIKSGGEWISSIEIENIAIGHPDIEAAAVIAMPHPQWDERPLLLAVARAGAMVTTDDIRGHLDGKIARWWMPDEIRIVDEIPLGATGKIDKKRLRTEVLGSG